MSTDSTTGPTGTARPGRALNITLWIFQGLLAAFFAIASAAPKLFSESAAVEGFEVIGAGQWFRYFVGALELAGAIGLVIPRLSGLAAIGLSLLMIGAAYTNAFVIDGHFPVITPLILLVFTAFIAWGRRGTTKALFERT
ncbi:DoxX family protein [Glycomyces xiaoerkulensis]|uniref:DoxX family protein n=1 Tax=Glycomyces xiaoerkulensis TaxID=2038139 RepID=UPI000C262821|nr:DoxX family protein [Glycomyces xiaoerkulensis]